MPDINSEYRKRFLRRQALFESRYRDIFDQVAKQFAELANNPNAKFTKAFRFPPVIQRRIDGIIKDFHGELLAITEDEIIRSWDLSNEKNDKIVSNYLKAITEIKAAQNAAYYMPNLRALRSFISRKSDAGTLSDAVWKIAKQLRAEMEVHLGIGIMNGDSAQIISQRIRQYLNNPDALFRRVRDKNGKLVPSKRMQDYHPGQGVYRSAYKNAMRLSRTETNSAYRTADSLRWQQLDMVKGIEIKLSASHPHYDFPEICEELAGIYPKDYVFIGNHPHCLCYAVPVLSSKEDFRNYLKTGIKEKNKMIRDYPPKFKEFWQANYERYMNYKTMPWIMEANLEAIKKVVNKQ